MPDIEQPVNQSKKEYEMISKNAAIHPYIESTRGGVQLQWNNIIYKASEKNEDSKAILQGVSGTAYPGELLAILGTSGAGKTTLLDVLSSRLVSKGLSGLITSNGSPIDKKSFRRESGYVKQSDALFPFLTVKETIRFASYLRIPNKTRAEKNEIADNTIKLLHLDDCEDTIVGDEQNKGISGGQKRRVSIAVDIIHQPKAIFLDEPTSGLDSSTAYSVVNSLHQIAQVKFSTIIMTIHQPSARIFNLLDKVMFLSNGRVTYDGLGINLQSYVSKIYTESGFGEVPLGNPPEIFLDLCDELKDKNQLDIISKYYNSNKFVNGDEKLLSNDDGNEEVTIANSILGDVYILCERAQINILRTKELFFARIGSALFFSTLIGTLFLKLGNSHDDIQFKAAYFVLNCAYFHWTSLEALPIFINEREIFQREYSSGAYRALSYTIATTIIYFPFLLLLAIVYTSISWWLIGFSNLASVFIFQILIIFVMLITAQSFVTSISTIVPDPMIGQTAGSAIFSIMFVFSGFFIRRAKIPDYWIYFHYMSLFKYGLDSQIVNAFKNNISNSMESNAQILASFSENNVDRWTGVGILIAWALFYRGIFYYRLITAFNGSKK